MDYQEKLVWGQFLPTVLLYGYYFVAFARSRHSSAAGPSLLGVVVLLAVVQVVFLILIAAFAKKEPRDERQRLLEYKAYKVAYLAALAGAIWWLSMAMAGTDTLTRGRLSEAVLLAGIIGVELLRTGTLLVLFRGGAQA